MGQFFLAFLGQLYTGVNTCDPVAGYGPLRMVRDVFHLSGFLCRDASGQIVQIVLNQDAHLARRLLVSLQGLLAPLHVVINLDKT